MAIKTFAWPPFSTVSTSPANGTPGAAAPTTATEVAGIDGGGVLRVFSTDVSGNQNVNVISSVLPSGASTSTIQTNGTQKTQVVDAAGNIQPSGDIAARAIKVDASATTQPVSGSVSILASGTALTQTSNALNVQIQNTSVPVRGNGVDGTAVTGNTLLVSGSDGTTQRNLLTDATGKLSVAVSSSALPTGAATETTLAALNTKVTAVNTGAVVVSSSVLPTGAATSAKQPALGTAGTASADVITVQGIATMTALKVDGSAVTQPVSIAATVTTAETTSSTSTVTSVASSATNVSLLASNASRKGAAFYNDSTQLCYLKLGTTASTTSYTLQIAAGSYYEIPSGKIYTGAIDGIWAAANGSMRITELT